jgi:hypothetical protein
VSLLVIGAPALAGQPSYVFVTSTLHDGDLGGLDGADAICNQAAAGNLPGTYSAWLSTATVAAWERVYDDPDGYRLSDGSPVALRLSDVCACSDVDCLINAINQTETGAPAPTNTNIGFATAWTGTWINNDACVISPLTCGDWQQSASGNGRVGDPTDVNLFWTEGSWDTWSDQPCFGEYSLYCFQNAPMFEDGFESGDTSAWSSTVP